MKTKILFLVFGLLLLTGCSSKELDSRDFVMIMGVDSENSLYNVTLDIYNTNEDSENEHLIFQSKGDSINKCFDRINKETSGDLFLGHMQGIILNGNVESEMKKFINEDFTIGRNIPVLTCDNSNKLLTQKTDDISLESYINKYFKNYSDKKVSVEMYIKNDDNSLPAISISNKKYMIE